LSLPRLPLSRRTARITLEKTARRGCLLVGILGTTLWHLSLVGYLAFHYYGAPNQFILRGLKLPELVEIHGFLALHAPNIAAVAGCVLGLALFLGPWKGSRGRVLRFLPLVASAWHLWNAFTIDAPLTVDAIGGMILADYALIAGVLANLLCRLPAQATFHTPPRPVVRTLLVGVAAIGVFYCLRELTVESWWVDLAPRASFFVLLGCGLLLLRGLVLEPLFATDRVSPWLKVCAFWILADALVAQQLSYLLAGHLMQTYRFLTQSNYHFTVFFNPLAVWVAFVFLAYDLFALSLQPRIGEVFGRRVPSIDSGVLLPLVPLDRLLRGTLPPTARFFVSWALVYGVAGVVITAWASRSFYAFMLGPVVLTAVYYVVTVFISSACLFVFRSTRVTTRTRAGGLVACAIVGSVAYFAPAIPSAYRWREIFVEYGAVERMVRMSLTPLAAEPDPRFRDTIARAKRHLNRYEIEKAGAPDIENFNVLILSSDAMRARNLGFNGYERRPSPVIDELASRSTVFSNAFSPGNDTISSIRAFVRGEPTGEPIPDMEGTWIREVVDKGVFDEAHVYNAHRLTLPDESESERIHFVHGFELDQRQRFREDLEGMKDKRFITWVHNMGTHMIYYLREEAEFYGLGELDLYDNNINYFDSFVGFALDCLRELGIEKRTIVIITSDHGELFNEHGIWGHANETFYDGSVRIPMIVHVPGQPARVCDRHVGMCDLAPTLIELAGYRVKDLPPWIESQRNVLIGREAATTTRTLPLITKFFGSIGVFRSDGLKYYLTPDAEILFDVHGEPNERKNLVRTREAEAESMRVLFRSFYELNSSH
jgi:hypothetical protein